MTSEYWISSVANHLWQSTVFAAAVWLLALALRKNHARTRSRLWLIASLKFLIPFSLLVGLGSHLSWPASTPIPPPVLPVTLERIAQPFEVAQSIPIAAPLVLARDSTVLPRLLLAIWICGFLVVAISWWRKWSRIRAAAGSGSPLDLDVDLPVLATPALLEPGVFGLFRPVLLLPEGITEHLMPAHVEAIVAHELCHVRRRDNLAAAMHMAVEAIFWFHPLVWWIGARLVEERERACDEEVLRLGSEPEVYAESILKICQFYLESPLACMSGISGADLKERIVRIMTQRLANRLGFGRKLLLTAAGMIAVAGPFVFGLVSASQSRAQSQPAPVAMAAFEVASVKPNKAGQLGMMLRNEPNGRFIANNVTLKLLMEIAYGVKEAQILGAPGWMDSERFDIEAKPEDSFSEEMQKLPQDKRIERSRPLLQSLLADRFQLKLHHDTKDLPVYALLVAKSGPKFPESAAPLPTDAPAPGPPGPRPQRGTIRMEGRGQLNMTGVGLDQFAEVLSRELGRVVLDKTGLDKRYDFKLRWTPGDDDRISKAGEGPDGKPSAAPPSDASGPSIFTALQEQLGLKLESQKSPVDTLVIDHVEKPSAN
jgi:bla regulator protein blaR1